MSDYSLFKETVEKSNLIEICIVRGLPVVVYLISGIKLTGFIVVKDGNDGFLLSGRDKIQKVYYNAISTIVLEQIKIPPEYNDTAAN